MTDEAQARYAWDVLKNWLGSSPDGRLILQEFTKNPEKRAGALDSWLRSHVDQVPPQLATYVQGGQVEKLVNIAEAGVVYFDSSGSGWFFLARGAARFFIVIGTAAGLAGFACFGYLIVKAGTTFNEGLAAAEARCRRQHPPGFELARCLSDANAMYGGFDFEPTPWLPLGAVLMFAGIVLSFVGMVLIRPHGR
jgi:hypothetical protein